MSSSQPYLSLNTSGPGFRIDRPNVSTHLTSMFRNKKLVACLVVFILILFAYNLNWHIGGGSIFSPLVYSIVIDAGSTGSRIHVFKLYHDNKNSELKKFDIKLLKQELLVKVKPGLSSYAKNPDEATESIKPLLNQALEVIPQKHQSLTHISLKATAGLRMISDEIANRILKNIGNLFKTYPFASNANDVGILDGKYEGIYSWLTLNYALKSFDEYKEASVCSLDLGGGSTQVTFIPNSKLNSQEKDYVVDFKLDESDYKIYAKSFLGFGLMSARMNIFKQDLHLKLLTKNSSDIFQNPNLLSSACLSSENDFKWVQQGVEYNVKGPANKKLYSFENCYKIAAKTIKGNIKAPNELRDKSLYAFSFYYDRLRSANLLEESGGVVKLSDILSKALSICNQSNSDKLGIDKTDKDYPFLCMDLTFIYTILADGFGIPNTKSINIFNKVNDMEINWALGAAFHML